MLEQDADKSSGFTLLELMVVVAIVSLLASISLPQYEDSVKRAKIGAALEFLAGPRTAATEALLTRNSAEYLAPISEPMEFLQCITVTRYKQGRNGDCNTVLIEAYPNENLEEGINLGRTRLLVQEGRLNASGGVDWRCGPFRNISRAVNPELLPGTCQDSIGRPSGRVCETGRERTLAKRCARGR